MQPVIALAWQRLQELDLATGADRLQRLPGFPPKSPCDITLLDPNAGTPVTAFELKWGRQDPEYGHSFKAFQLQRLIERARSLLAELAPADAQLNAWFTDICSR